MSSRSRASRVSSSMVVLLLIKDARRMDVAERGAQPGPGSIHPRPDRSRWHAKRLGHLVVAQLGPGDEQHHIALAGVERGDRRGHGPAGGVSGQPCVQPVGKGLGHRVSTGPFQGSQLADLVAMVPPHQVARYAVQPGPGVRPVQVVTAALPERREERLGDDVLGRVRAETPGDIAADAGRMAPEQQRELLGFMPRPPDDLRVGWASGRRGGHGALRTCSLHAATLRCRYDTGTCPEGGRQVPGTPGGRAGGAGAGNPRRGRRPGPGTRYGISAASGPRVPGRALMRRLTASGGKCEYWSAIPRFASNRVILMPG